MDNLNKVVKKLEAVREVCIDINGISYCKNCGLDFEDLISLLNKYMKEGKKNKTIRGSQYDLIKNISNELLEFLSRELLINQQSKSQKADLSIEESDLGSRAFEKAKEIIEIVASVLNVDL